MQGTKNTRIKASFKKCPQGINNFDRCNYMSDLKQYHPLAVDLPLTSAASAQ